MRPTSFLHLLPFFVFLTGVVAQDVAPFADALANISAALAVGPQANSITPGLELVASNSSTHASKAIGKAAELKFEKKKKSKCPSKSHSHSASHHHTSAHHHSYKPHTYHHTYTYTHAHHAHHPKSHTSSSEATSTSVTTSTQHQTTSRTKHHKAAAVSSPETTTTSSSPSTARVEAVTAVQAFRKGIPSTTADETTTATVAPKSESSPKSESLVSTVEGAVKGLMGFVSSNCGASGASSTHPNGAEEFLNCGVNDGGWTPPKGITLDMIKTVSIEDALAGNSVWAPCKPYTSLFEKYAKANGLPPILLAAFALQESTCQPDILGDNGGAFGLMQITKDKCGGQSTSGCADPDYNIKTAAAYFADTLSQNNGNFLVSLGAYNGWFAGMTYEAATAAKNSGCCECQQNLDYLFQMLNGWLLGKTGYELGSIGNLDSCSNQS